MRRYTVLVSGASGIVGYGILKSLRKYGDRLIGTTIYETSPANCFADVVEIAPVSTSEQYISWFLDIINRYQVDIAIPGIEADMAVWNTHRDTLESAGVVLVLNNKELIRLCLDKWEFYKKMWEMNSKYRIFSSLDPNFDQFALPFILKPRRGYGSKGVVIVDDENIFQKFKLEIGNNLMMQEYVGSSEEEYTVSAFFDMDSDLKAFISLRRRLSGQGFTEIAEVVVLEDIAEVIIDLSKIFKPIGPTNFQFRKHNGVWKLLEINPRISSATSIRAAFGYNEAEMSIEYFLEKKEIICPKIKSGEAIRYTEDYIIYD